VWCTENEAQETDGAESMGAQIEVAPRSIKILLGKKKVRKYNKKSK